MILILIASLLLPFVAELIGIIINLKYPKMDASNDTEVVKQSMSSVVATFIGMGLLGATIVFMVVLFSMELSNSLIMLIVLGIYALVCLGLWTVLNKTCEKSFNSITV